jgi:xylan 1,4-beta-xylosidase
LSVSGIGNEQVLLQHYRVDEHFSNSFEAWKSMGRPQQVTSEQYETLERAGQLQTLESPQWKKAKDGIIEVQFNLPRQGVSMIRMSW